MPKLALSLLAAIGLSCSVARAQTIYPIDRAEILAGSRFDLKIEFPGAPAEVAVKVTIDGQSPADLLGQPGSFRQDEESSGHSAFWVRGASLLRPGAYTVEATAGGRTAQVIKRHPEVDPLRR